LQMCILFLSTRCSATFTLQRQNKNGFSSTRTETERYLQKEQRRHHTTNVTRRRILRRAGVFKPSNSFCATSHGLQAQRLSKVLSSRGICSRREADELISGGGVLAESRIAKCGTKVALDTEVEVRGVVGLRALRRKSTIFLNKPTGIVSNLPDINKNEKEAYDLVMLRNAKHHEDAGSTNLAEKYAASGNAEKFHVCGRLDKHSRGLLLLSQDGTLGRAATRGYNTPKTYLVEVEEIIMDSQIRTLNGHVSFAGEIIVPMRVRKLAPRLLEFVLLEGKNRQIRRVCEHAGMQVVDLIRVKVSSCELGDLREGSWQVLSQFDANRLKQMGRQF